MFFTFNIFNINLIHGLELSFDLEEFLAELDEGNGRKESASLPVKNDRLRTNGLKRGRWDIPSLVIIFSFPPFSFKILNSP
jgi:hypothetical protein